MTGTRILPRRERSAETSSPAKPSFQGGFTVLKWNSQNQFFIRTIAKKPFLPVCNLAKPCLKSLF
jgi:hypothetical protein